MSPENRAGFFKANANMFKEDLKKSVETFVELKVQQKLEVVLTGNGDFMDEEDLRTKYAAKPRRADQIIKNTRSFVCPIAEVKFYEHMSYKSTVNESFTKTTTESEKMEQPTNNTQRTASNQRPAKPRPGLSDFDPRRRLRPKEAVPHRSDREARSWRR